MQSSLSDHEERALHSVGPKIEKRRLEAIRRTVAVISVEELTPRLRRITFWGDDLATFNSPSPDDHIKLFFKTSGDVEMRDYTPRRFDAEKRTLVVDFVLHEEGAATDWARTARPGDELQIGGPRGSTIISADGCWWLLIGDETALPSIGRRIEELNKGTNAISLICVESPSEELHFSTAAEHVAHWVHRPMTQATDPGPFLEALARLQLPSGPGFVWIAAESGVSRALRDHVVSVLGHPSEWTKASAYWEAGGDVNSRH